MLTTALLATCFAPTGSMPLKRDSFRMAFAIIPREWEMVRRRLPPCSRQSSAKRRSSAANEPSPFPQCLVSLKAGSAITMFFLSTAEIAAT